MTRPDRRMITRTMLIAASDATEYGWPVRMGPAKEADFEGTCGACGWPIEVGQWIQLARRAGYIEVGWVHATCESWWVLISKLIETKSDPRIILKDGEGRPNSKCSWCGRDVGGEPIHQIRLPLPLATPNVQPWICTPCLKGEE